MKLFDPVKIGEMELKNRIIMAPMSINLADEGAVTEKMIRFYEERAKGGVGLIVVEDGIIDVPVGNNVKKAVAIDQEHYIPKLKELVTRVKRQGAKVTIQLSHGGRRAGRISKESGFLEVTRGKIPVAPSSIAHPVPGYVVPHELTVEEIEDIVEKFGMAATRVREAGFDAVSLHCAHMYLCGQFLSPWANQREDAYGGSLTNRVRFVKEVMEAIRENAGSDMPLICRMNGAEPPGGNSSEEIREIASALEEAQADAIHVSTGFAASIKSAGFIPSVTPMNFPQGCIIPQAENIKKGVSIPVIAVNMIRDVDFAEKVLVNEQADMIALGRPLITDPMFPAKALENKIKDIKPCISCCQGCITEVVERDNEVSCTVNPTAGRETEAYFKPSTEKIKRVVIVGAGPAGLSAAVTAAQLGHEVVLYDKEETCGGRLYTAMKPPGKKQIERLLEYYNYQLKKYPISFKGGLEVDWKMVEQENPEAVILAIGAKPLKPGLPGIDNPNVVMAVDVLEENAVVGENAVIIGGGQVGLETADYLSEKGIFTTVVEMKDKVGEDMPSISRNQLLSILEDREVKILTGTKVSSIYKTGIEVTKKKGTDFVPGETVIISTGFEPVEDLEGDPGDNIPVFRIGDFYSPRKMYDAIHEGFYTALKI